MCSRVLNAICWSVALRLYRRAIVYCKLGLIYFIIIWAELQKKSSMITNSNAVFFYLISYTTKRCISVWYLFLNDPSGKLISRDAILNHSCKDSFEIYFNKKYEKGKTFDITLALSSYQLTCNICVPVPINAMILILLKNFIL